MYKYTIVSPVRNEEEFIERTILSVINQTHLPLEYILVNDGSTDKTKEIIEKYTAKYQWIHCYDRPKGVHHPGAGVVEAFYTGYKNILDNSWDFIVKLDGDLSFQTDYFELLLKKFESNPKLGMASGITVNPSGKDFVMDKMPEDHVRGSSKIYRRQCFEEIGGLPRVLGWDTIDELKAQVLGWETRSYKEFVMIHYKPIGAKQTNIIKRELIAGERHHYLGYHPVFAIARDCYRMLQKPFIIAGVLNIAGFIMGYASRKERIDEALIKHLRKKQMERITFRRKLW